VNNFILLKDRDNSIINLIVKKIIRVSIHIDVICENPCHKMYIIYIGGMELEFYYRSLKCLLEDFKFIIKQLGMDISYRNFLNDKEKYILDREEALTGLK